MSIRLHSLAVDALPPRNAAEGVVVVHRRRSDFVQRTGTARGDRVVEAVEVAVVVRFHVAPARHRLELDVTEEAELLEVPRHGQAVTFALVGARPRERPPRRGSDDHRRC